MKPTSFVVEESLVWTLEHVAPRARQARLAFGTNDVLVLFNIRPDRKSGHAYARPRERTLESCADLLSDYPQCLAIIKDRPTNPNHVPCIAFLPDGACVAWIYDTTGSQAGVLS